LGKHTWRRGATLMSLLMLTVTLSVTAGDKVLTGTRVPIPAVKGNSVVRQRCLTPQIPEKINRQLKRARPWSLPNQALAATTSDTLNVLVLRFNFQYETVDDPNTTGRGWMNLANPLASFADSAAYYDSIGHWIDPPPHNRAYFNAQMTALNRYWNWVSEGKIALKWDVYPQASDSVYQLPYPMRHYGLCDSVIVGLERYFEDCIHLADSLPLIDPNHPEIDFTKYDAIILFHAGADRQNDIGFPTTCSDLFTGYIKFGDSIPVNDSAKYVRTALLMPETASQDNRATALNAVIAHEFGHELGLVDLYNTSNFFSQLGDFSLMDDNGFGTGIDFSFKVGNVFGAIPIYPDAWSRAYLGYVPVVDFRKGTDLRLVAAEVASTGIQIARVPISENQYYLIENRNQQITGKATYVLADAATGVIQGPINPDRQFTGEYDYLIPGSGMLIYLVDEGVASLDYNDDGTNNFEDNQLQWDPKRKFITLIEGDGIVNFGGNYLLGYGKAEDMYREDRNHALTPNSNPQALDNFGNDTRVYITNIRRDTIVPVGGTEAILTDSVMRFDVETDKLVAGFPIRVGYPKFGLSPVADDLLGNGHKEIIVASGQYLTVFDSAGENFLKNITGCTSCPEFLDSAFSSTNPGTPHLLPLYLKAQADITAGPVTGNFGDTAALGKHLLIAVGDAARHVYLCDNTDIDANGQADFVGTTVVTKGAPIALSFGRILWALDDQGDVYWLTSLNGVKDSVRLNNTEYHGIGRVGISRLAMVAGDSLTTKIYVIDTAATVDSFAVAGRYNFGPVTADMNNDGRPEIVLFTSNGEGIYVTLDTSAVHTTFSVLAHTSTGYRITANPIATDIDLDGRPDIVVAGINTLYAFDQRLVLKSDYPRQIDDRSPNADVIAAPITGEIDKLGTPEIVFPNETGSIHAISQAEAAGFPLNGGVKGAGSCLILVDSSGGKLGYVGADGWFYLWHIDTDSTRNAWPMGGHDPSGSFTLTQHQIGNPQEYSDLFPKAQFFNYPNPVTNGTANFRYQLGKAADRVVLTVFDLSGRKVTELQGSTFVGENQQAWDCGAVTPGVYRCRIEVDFGGDTRTAFTDVAVIR
jgi:M6 family metalloprotease-like protein